MAQRRFRFGIVDESSQTREHLVHNAQQAERLGYSTFLIRDHFIQGDFLHQLAPIATLATVAAVTTTLRIGTLVFDNDYRHPALLAKEAATLDLLSGGRLELGLGAGWLQEEYEQTGIPFDSPGTRIERLRESVQVLKGLFAASPFSLQGKHYQITNLDSFPKPVQQPHPPILIGGGGVSTIYDEPEWQKNLPNQDVLNGKRGLPDVAWGAAVNFAVLQTVEGLPQWAAIGGTSASAPQWAGLVAIANQMAGKPLGFLNPALYKLAGQGFHDITKGGNGLNGVTGFQATTGWDAVSGWGTPDAYLLLPKLIDAAQQTGS